MFRSSILVVILGVLVFASSRLSADEPTVDLKRASETLRDSDKPGELKDAAILLICSGRPEQIAQVVDLLRQPAFLDRLDSPDLPKRRFWNLLPITAVLNELGRLEPKAASQAMLYLLECPPFVRDTERRLAIFAACGQIQSPSTSLLAHFDEYITPKNGGGAAIRTLAKMGHPTAIRLIEQRFLDLEYNTSSKQGWLEGCIVFQRHKPAVVDMYRVVIEAELEDGKVRNAAVDTLFNFRPLEWFGPNSGILAKPVPWKDVSTPVLDKILLIAEVAEKQQLEKEVREGMRDACKTIRAVLADRAKDS